MDVHFLSPFSLVLLSIHQLLIYLYSTLESTLFQALEIEIQDEGLGLAKERHLVLIRRRKKLTGPICSIIGISASHQGQALFDFGDGLDGSGLWSTYVVFTPALGYTGWE